MIDEQNQENLIKPSNKNLINIAADIVRPIYDRTNLKAGIIHIGLGNFHRAHQSWYLHRLMQQGLAQDWAIIGAGVRSYDIEMREKLLAQDCLTTLIELDPSGTEAEVIGSMIDYLPVEEGNGALINAMAQPNIRIVSLTVTEGGYYIDPVTGGLDITHTDIKHDIERHNSPLTAFGAIVETLRIRRENGLKPFTAQSCDNLQGNGDILRNTIITLANAIDPSLAKWISENGAFPNSMVDCIVPATGEKEIELAKTFGLDDAAPVTHENFRQWVIEDDFCAGRPDWDLVGATFTNNVHDYETMKIRMLNAGHQIIANVAEILSVETISDCMAHPLISGLLKKVESEEIIRFVAPVPNMTPTAYLELISQRFSNSKIRDTTRRVAFDGSSRHPGFVLPILRQALEANSSIDGLSLVEALWARMCSGIREDGTKIEANDPYWDQLTLAANATKENPQAWLDQDQFYGDLGQNQRFKERFEHWLNLIWSKGAAHALEKYLA